MSMTTLLAMASIGSVGAMAGAMGIAVAAARWRERLLPLLLAYSAGTMLAAALLGMLPRALRSLPDMQGGLMVLAGLLFLFALERLLLWHHCHDSGCQVHRASGRLLLVGDAFHNFVDGIVIAAAFRTSPELGWAATLAVVAHEVPQEMGDYAVLLDSGMGRWQALGWNLLSALATLPGAVLGYLLLSQAQTLTPYLLALSGASFLYIALGDLMPRLHLQQGRSWLALLMLVLGMATILMVRLDAH
jgi:zinc and cadmium transporter